MEEDETVDWDREQEEFSYSGTVMHCKWRFEVGITRQGMDPMLMTSLAASSLASWTVNEFIDNILSPQMISFVPLRIE